ncbi:hypothetical protein [Bacteroides oleiciplenus]|uniref:hypothetical protein n=1 Tax=Bacteroides oleiciplenus TaxID=626931 RepID=UPI0026DAA13C|nr:hypothetical protein [Bacteroides oleiciplenus]
MKKILFLMVFLVALVGCKQEKSNVSVDTSQQITDSIFNEKFYNDSVAADNEKKELEKKRLEEARLDSISKVETEKTIKELSRYFTFRKDEFSNDDRVWVEPKDAPKYLNRNGIYCYFQTNNDKASNLRLKIQYTADDWLFIRYYVFSIDGMVYEYRPDDIETDHKSTIWEWADNQVTSFDQSLITALMMAKSAKIRYVGRQYNKDRAITAQQLLSIKRTVQLYRAMGGRIN